MHMYVLRGVLHNINSQKVNQGSRNIARERGAREE